MYPRTFHLLLPWCLCVSFALAQTPKPPGVVSPEVRGDRTVTFRIHAPKATEVLVTGDWMGRTDKPIPLSKGDDGVWVGAAGPLEPNMYLYSFSVDGVRTPDPANTNTIVTGGRFPQSGLEIRGDRAVLGSAEGFPKGPFTSSSSTPHGRIESGATTSTHRQATRTIEEAASQSWCCCPALPAQKPTGSPSA
jgi:hypothetical protein